MYFLGYTFNTVTLLALLLLIGVVVDDAIVVLENIYRRREMGQHDPMQAAIDGSQEVIFAVIAAVLCVLLGVVAGLKLWGSVCAFVAALTITAVAARRRDLPALGAGICMVLAFATFAAQLSAGPLRPGEFLHIGLALAMLLLGRWATVRHSRESGNPGGMDPRS
jgi:hypothetical protein